MNRNTSGKLHPIGYISYSLTMLVISAIVIYTTVILVQPLDDALIPYAVFLFKKVPYATLFKVGYFFLLASEFEDYTIWWGLSILILFYLDIGFFGYALTRSLFRSPGWRIPVCIWFGVRLAANLLFISLLSFVLSTVLFILYFFTIYLSQTNSDTPQNHPPT